MPNQKKILVNIGQPLNFYRLPHIVWKWHWRTICVNRINNMIGPEPVKWRKTKNLVTVPNHISINYNHPYLVPKISVTMQSTILTNTFFTEQGSVLFILVDAKYRYDAHRACWKHFTVTFDGCRSYFRKTRIHLSKPKQTTAKFCTTQTTHFMQQRCSTPAYSTPVAKTRHST